MKIENMTNEQAAECLKTIHVLSFKDETATFFLTDVQNAFKLAIKALEQQPSENCISKELVIEWLKDKDIIKTKNQEENARRELAELPSVTPSYNSIKTELKPSEDCINRAQALHACCDEWNKDYKAIMKSIRQLPSVTPQPSEDWYDVPSDEMTLEQARQAVKNLRKKLAEHLEQQPNRCDSCVHLEERDGSNCYECVKGITDNFELMRDATEEERKSVKDYVESISKPTGVHFDETQPTDADCISREAVYELLAKEDWADTVIGIKELPSVTPQPRWIPVSERLPENRMFCLITVKITPYGYNSTYEVHIAWFDGRNFIDKVNTDNVIAKRSVVAWMPLPTVYQGE